MANIGSLVYNVLVNTSQLVVGVQQIDSKLTGIQKSAAAAGKALGAAFGIATIGAAVSQFTEFAGRISDLSAKTGIGVEALQKLGYAAKMNSGSLEHTTRRPAPRRFVGSRCWTRR